MLPEIAPRRIPTTFRTRPPMLELLRNTTRPARIMVIKAVRPLIRSANDQVSGLLHGRLPLLVARLSPLKRVKRRPEDIFAWLALAMEVGGQPAALVAAHGLTQPQFLAGLSVEMRRQVSPRLIELAKALHDGRDAKTVGGAVEEIVRWQNIFSVREAFNYGIRRPGHYFGDAEPYMEKQWNTVIWPIIKESDFSSTLDIACGHGRQTEFLRRHAREIHLVDINEACIEACRDRFGTEINGCRFHYHVTDGNHLRMIVDNSITFVCSWDAMVHFDKTVMRDYIIEISRILKPGGTAFLHHSNIGAIRPNSNWLVNHGSRGDMSAELFRDYAYEAGLTMAFQRLSGTQDGWGMDDLDCLSLAAKPY
jgi:SAM-dependent methyltransferase